MPTGRNALFATMIALAMCGVWCVPAHAATVEIEINNLAFSKAVAQAKVGDTVVWVNKDIFAHTSTAKNGDWRVVIPAGKSASVVLKKTGPVEYYCEYHPTMTARLIVAEADNGQRGKGRGQR